MPISGEMHFSAIQKTQDSSHLRNALIYNNLNIFEDKISLSFYFGITVAFIATVSQQSFSPCPNKAEKQYKKERRETVL
jgi:hypothetical protein